MLYSAQDQAPSIEGTTLTINTALGPHFLKRVGSLLKECAAILYNHSSPNSLFKLNLPIHFTALIFLLFFLYRVTSTDVIA